MSKFLTGVCTDNIPPTTPNPPTLERKLLIYGQIIIVNKIDYSYLHVKFGVVCP